MMVKNHDNLDDIAHDLSLMYYSVAGFTTALLVLIVLRKYGQASFFMHINHIKGCYKVPKAFISHTMECVAIIEYVDAKIS